MDRSDDALFEHGPGKRGKPDPLLDTLHDAFVLPGDEERAIAVFEARARDLLGCNGTAPLRPRRRTGTLLLAAAFSVLLMGAALAGSGLFDTDPPALANPPAQGAAPDALRASDRPPGWAGTVGADDHDDPPEAVGRQGAGDRLDADDGLNGPDNAEDGTGSGAAGCTGEPAWIDEERTGVLAEYEDAVAEARAERDEALAALADEQQEALADLHEEIRSTEADYAADLRDLQQEWNEADPEDRSEIERETAAVERERDEAIAELEAEREDVLAGFQDERDEVLTDYEEVVAGALADRDEALAGLDREAEAACAS